MKAIREGGHGMGPLTGYRIIELAGIGPGPFCGMMLADMGAEVIRIDRYGATARGQDVLGRGRKSIALDLKNPKQSMLCLSYANPRTLCLRASTAHRAFRPWARGLYGQKSKIGLRAHDRVGQEGPMAQAAVTTLTTSLQGAACYRPKDGKPVPPLNLVGDFGGGGMLLAFGIACGDARGEEVGQRAGR